MSDDVTLPGPDAAAPPPRRARDETAPAAPRRGRGRLLLVVLPLGVIVGLVYGWRWVMAPLMGLALLRWLIASLRVFVEDAKDDLALPPVEDGPERTVFRCAECGTEVLLLYRGTPKAPSHCGQRMDARTELLR